MKSWSIEDKSMNLRILFTEHTIFMWRERERVECFSSWIEGRENILQQRKEDENVIKGSLFQKYFERERETDADRQRERERGKRDCKLPS